MDFADVGYDREYHGNPAGTLSPRRLEEGDFLILVKGISF
jgi:hypothetical protein